MLKKDKTTASTVGQKSSDGKKCPQENIFPLMRADFSAVKSPSRERLNKIGEQLKCCNKIVQEKKYQYKRIKKG